jgi:CyaY protein
MVSDSGYVALAQAELAALVAVLDELAADDLDCELENDILTLELGDDTTYVINSHRAARQIWMAAERTAWHFDWDADQGTWIAHKTGDELWATVRRVLAPHLPARLVERLTRSKP